MEDVWRMTVELNAGSFSALQYAMEQAASHVARAKGFKAAMGGSGWGSGGGPGAGYTIEIECPVEAKIAQLRKEADDLEATIR